MKVCFSDVSAIQMFTIQITVLGLESEVTYVKLFGMISLNLTHQDSTHAFVDLGLFRHVVGNVEHGLKK